MSSPDGAADILPISLILFNSEHSAHPKQQTQTAPDSDRPSAAAGRPQSRRPRRTHVVRMAEQKPSLLTQHESYSWESIRRRAQRPPAHHNLILSSTPAAPQRRSLSSCAHKLIRHLRKKKRGSSSKPNGAAFVDFSTAHEVTTTLNAAELSIDEIRKTYAMMMSKYGRSRFPANPQHLHLYLYHSSLNRGHRILSDTFLTQKILSWRAAAPLRHRAAIRRVLTDTVADLHTSSPDQAAAAALALWQLCSSEEPWLPELHSMRALGAHIQEGICSALSLLAHDAQKLCLLLGAIWQLAARTDVLDSERLAPLLLQQLEQPVSEVVAGRKAVYMTLGGLLALKRDGWAASAMALRALMGCVVRCQDTGDEESLEVALTLVCRRARDLLEFVHDAVPVETLRALVRGLAAFKERPLQMTLLQVTLLVNVGVRVKPGEALADAMGSMEMIGALLRIAQRALRVKESPSIALLRHGVCRLVNTWLLVSSERTKLADDESSVKIMVDFVTRQVGWSQASEQEFCATECLLNMHRWLCETGRFAELEAVSARLVINRLRFSEHERSFRSVTDRVRTPKEYSGLIANGAVSALLKGVEQRSSRHKMRGFMQMLIGCVASVSKEAHGLNESVPKSILRLLARQSTEHEDKQALLCALMMACRNAAFPSQVADPEEELLPVLVHCLRFFVHDFSDPFFEMMVYIIWAVMEESKPEEDMDTLVECFRTLLSHLQCTTKLMQMAPAEEEKLVPPHLVNIFFEPEIHLWSLVTFKRSLLELDGIGAKRRVSQILGFYESRDEAVEAMIAYESAAEAKRTSRVIKEKTSKARACPRKRQQPKRPKELVGRLRMLISLIFVLYQRSPETFRRLLWHPDCLGMLFYLGLTSGVSCSTVKRLSARLLWDLVCTARESENPAEDEKASAKEPVTSPDVHPDSEVVKSKQDDQDLPTEVDPIGEEVAEERAPVGVKLRMNLGMTFRKPREYYLTRFVYMATELASSRCRFLQADAAFYLASLAKRTECRRIVAQHGGIPALLQLLKHSPKRSRTGYNAVVGLSLLCYSRTNQEMISRHGGLQALISVCEDTLPEGQQQDAAGHIGYDSFKQQKVARWVLFLLKQNACNATRLYKAELKGKRVPVQVRRDWTFAPSVQEVNEAGKGYKVLLPPAIQSGAARSFAFQNGSSVKAIEKWDLDDAEAEVMKEVMFSFEKVRGSTMLPELPTYISPDGRAFHLCFGDIPEHPCREVAHIERATVERCGLDKFLEGLDLSQKTAKKFGMRLQSRQDLHLLHSFWHPTLKPLKPPLPQSVYGFYNVIAKPTHALLEQVGRRAGRILPQGHLRFYCVHAVKRSRWSVIKKSFFATTPQPQQDKQQDGFTSIISAYVNTIRRDRSILRKDFSLLLRKPSFSRLVKGCADTVQWTLCEHASLLLGVFRYFSAHQAEPENAFTMTSAAFHTLVSELDLVDKDGLNWEQVEAIFDALSDRSEPKETQGICSDERFQGNLLQHEFIEVMIRLATITFQGNPLAVALHLLITERLWRRFSREKVLDLDAFRYKVLHLDNVNSSLLEHKDLLINLFKHFAGKTEGMKPYEDTDCLQRLSLHDWLEFATQFKFIHQLSLSKRDSTLVYALTVLNKNTDVTSLESWNRSNCLDFARFSEAVCRLCDVATLPPEEAFQECSTLPESYMYMRAHGMKSCVNLSSVRIKNHMDLEETMKLDLGLKLRKLLQLVQTQFHAIRVDSKTKQVLNDNYHMQVLPADTQVTGATSSGRVIIADE